MSQPYEKHPGLWVYPDAAPKPGTKLTPERIRGHYESLNRRRGVSISRETLDQLEKLERGATAGPWHHRGIMIYDGEPWDTAAPVANADYRDPGEPNAEFIAELRNNAPDLIAAARRVEELEQAYEYILVAYYDSEKNLIRETSSHIASSEAELTSECDGLARQYLGKGIAEVLA